MKYLLDTNVCIALINGHIGSGPQTILKSSGIRRADLCAVGVGVRALVWSGKERPHRREYEAPEAVSGRADAASGVRGGRRATRGRNPKQAGTDGQADRNL